MFLQTIVRLLRLGNFLGILLLIFGSSCIVQGEYDNSVSCASKDSCQKCLETPECTWCEQPNFSGNNCLPDYLISQCAENYRISHNIIEERIRDEMLTSRNVLKESQKIVQLRPQQLSLKMPINQAHHVYIQYSIVEDYPIDVYLLIDLSNSTEADIEKHTNLADKLSEAVQKISSNFRLGFGIFTKKKSDDSYGFQNHHYLSTNSSTFVEEVKNAAVSGISDGPAGGLNALMQALACPQQIGWRQEARRLLIFSSDASFQHDDDEKLAAVISTNDSECHLDANGFYKVLKEQSNPSGSQINQKVHESYINIIFAVNQNQLSLYEKLSRHIEGSLTGLLSMDSSNIVELVQYEYNKISSYIEMKDNATSNIDITYYSSCLMGFERKTSVCFGLKVGDIVTFKAKILATSCLPDQRDRAQTIKIYPVGIDQSLVIDLTTLCSCECENPNYETYQEKSPKCSGFGTYMCGKCVCDDGHYGQNCECSSTYTEDLSCSANNMTIECSGRGTCICGACACNMRSNPEEHISGKYCECDNFSCDRKEGKLCAGPDHGTCECGQCICNPEWEGSDCSCLKSIEPCKSANGGEICSGNGECQCGQCKCKSSEEGRYSGKYCEKCPTCPQSAA